jgi:hypothetical protein
MQALLSGLEESGYAFFHDYYLILGACGLGFLLEQLQRFVNGFVGEAEGAVVHGNHPAGFEVEEGAHGVCGIGVYVAKLRRIVSPDGE